MFLLYTNNSFLAGLRKHELGVRASLSMTDYITCLLSRAVRATVVGLRDAEGNKSQAVFELFSQHSGRGAMFGVRGLTIALHEVLVCNDSS